ncbi:MAG: 8-amino-7-oxononanoate synthase [Deltaproteobacteria bacterium]|nr:8-amino-7-oxononanoate synthase [Deltaproteobacteria bacterium]
MNPVWHQRLKDLADRHLERRMRVVDGPVGPVVSTGDGEKLCFASNDYLGFANHTRIRQALADAATKWGVGAASSRLVSGNTLAHDRLENELAKYLGTDEAVLFPSGYQANVGAISALTDRGDTIFSDALVHASLVDGCRLSRAHVQIFRHRDAAHLNELLQACDTSGLKLIVTDSVFSMDGDLAPLAQIAKIAKANGALVYVDEAHAIGVKGPAGRGLCAELELEESVAVRVGTFGKALGSCGAFVATDRNAAGLIRSRARSLLYTTAAPAPIVEAAAASLEIVKSADDQRRTLDRNIEIFRTPALEAGLSVLDSKTPIQPVVIGDASRTMVASELLWKRGLFVQGMRPPTVPEGTSRLRVTLTAAHEPTHIKTLVRVLVEVLSEIGVHP